MQSTKNLEQIIDKLDDKELSKDLKFTLEKHKVEESADEEDERVFKVLTQKQFDNLSASKIHSTSFSKDELWKLSEMLVKSSKEVVLDKDFLDYMKTQITLMPVDVQIYMAKGKKAILAIGNEINKRSERSAILEGIRKIKESLSTTDIVNLPLEACTNMMGHRVFIRELLIELYGLEV